ncbi:MAG TPA: hypothetical protein VHZ73_01640, partial [Vicinamibacterales bacterium]|nr:hypothetical protein [Vicinamibacterales bacterium]
MKKISRRALLLLCGCLLARTRVSAAADIEGEWSVEFSTGDVESEADTHMYIKQDGSRLTGYIEWTGSATDFPLKGTLADDSLQIVWSTNVNGRMSDITFRGTAKGDEISGTVEVPGH